MNQWNKKSKIILGIIVLFLAAQLIQPSKNQGNAGGPNDITQTVRIPENVLTLLKKSCYDCHSNHTNYPWYDHITPVNWWVAGHINEGKEELNFTVFGQYKADDQMKMLEGIGETVKSGEMPLKSYLLTHGEARLSEGEKQAIFEWTKQSINQ